MKLHKKIAAVMLCAALLFATACGTAPAQEQSAAPDSSTPTIRFLLRGTASGMDRVLDALYAQMDDDHRWQLDFTFVDSGDYAQQLARSLTAHDNYDFVFDAPWQSLAMQTEQKNYKNLKNYFNNPEYPALQAAFSEEYLAANTISGGLYAIPFTNTYYDVPGIFYRKDLLQTLGLPFDEITNRAEMEQYWAAVRKKGEMKPISLGSRGFYQYNLPEITLRQNGIWVSQGWSFWDYPSQILLSSDGKQVLDVVFPGDSNEHFAALPEGYQTNFLDAYLQQNAADSQWLSPDDLLQENGAQVFLLGQSASYEASLASGTGQVQQQLRTIVPEGEVAFWAYDDAFLPQNRAQGSIPTTYAAWNDLCVPSYSTNTIEAMRFLDWLYSDWSRIDLFNYGVEGTDWQVVGDEEYTLLQPMGEAFRFPSYELAWNPQHHRIDTALPDEEKALLEFTFDQGSYAASPLAGFTLNTTPIAIEIAGLNSLYAEYYTAFGHGAYGAQTQEKIDELHTRSEAIGLETVRAEIIRQIQTHLDKNSAE